MGLLLVFTIGCALAVAFTRDLLTAAVVFMGQSLVMSIIWLILESPDLGITEAAVGAGIDSLLLFVALKKIHAIDSSIDHATEISIEKTTDMSTENHEIKENASLQEKAFSTEADPCEEAKQDGQEE
ncbi:MAG: DUF4040 domain-containing protein [Clostridia bacterium]|nr:DUF4040 domain-containing protein [Clostridia bacterium]